MKLILITFVATILVASTSVAQVPNYVPTNGLVGWWGFNGNANDESGNGNNGTVNGATLTSDRFGNPNSAYDFDGTQSYLHMNNNFDLDERTFSFWFNPILDNSSQTIIGHDNPTLNYGHTIAEITSSNELFLQSGTPGITNILLTNNQWFHIVITRNVDSTSYFMENIFLYSEINQNLASNNAILEGLTIGTTRNVDRFFPGQIDDIGIWDRALTPCEISDLYNAQLGSLNTTGSETITECSSFTWGANNQTYTSTGQYTAVLTNSAGCDSTVTLNLTITEPTTGSETITECSSYTWGANNQTYTSTGQYTAVLINSAGCDSTVTLNLTITEPTTGSETITECSSFTWGANNQTYTSTGQYTAVLTNAVGCDSTVTLDLTINNIDNGITQVDDFTLEANASGATYQWIDCKDDSPIAGATNQQFIPTENGEYAVIVTQNGCSDTSECLSVVRLSLEENQNQELKVYPNPATSSITISSESNIVGKSFTILNQLGQVVISGEIKHQDMVVNLTNLSAGVYVINISGESQSTFRIVKD